MQALILLDKVDLIPIKSTDDKGTKRLLMFGVMLPIYFVVTLLFKKSDIEPLEEKYNNNWDKVFKGNVWLIVYIIASFASIFILASLKQY